MRASTLNNSLCSYNFLSIGARGVGKTVFFIAHYIEQMQSSSLWFNCDDLETQQTLTKIRQYVAQTQEYPPATMKITNFDFQVQKQQGNSSQPVGRVCWWDAPGESCQLYNPAFLTMITNMDGSCLFLDAQRLVRSINDPTALQAQLQPIKTLADLLHHNGFTYPIALVITKCDLLSQASDRLTLQRILQPLIEHLNQLNLTYRLFYSEIPLVDGNLQANTQDNPLIWLIETVQSQVPLKLISSSSLRQSQIDSPLKRLQQKVTLVLRNKVAILASFLVITTIFSLSAVFLSEKAVNSEQNTPAFLPPQLK